MLEKDRKSRLLKILKSEISEFGKKTKEESTEVPAIDTQILKDLEQQVPTVRTAQKPIFKQIKMEEKYSQITVPEPIRVETKELGV